ncbi:putative porin [uncultured Parabacteroides sp.]|uniref:putative porin n=1 Tax=uncultured Parabacteroides sp. TaxID=512312 RepID=UPI0025E6C350|nr:putative porin [uncultured Parabacteroides sp.]
MKHCLYILLLLIVSAVTVQAQRGARGRSEGGGKRGGFSLSNLSSSQKEIPDSLLVVDSAALKSKRLIAYHLTPLLGEAYVAPLDTNKLNFGNTTLVESKSLAIGYLANLGSPAQTKIFSERKEPRDFIFADAYDYYITTPENAYFYNTKIPYTNIMYTSAGGSTNKEEQLKGTMTMNFGKKINVGGDIDYIYGRGHYKDNGDKLLSYRLFGSYQTDRYEMHAYLSNFNFVNYENGGLANDSTINHPDEYFPEGRPSDTKSYDVRYLASAWNRVRGKRYFLTQRYNLGFTRELEETDEEGNPKEVFVPVSSIIHTIDYEDNRRRFISHSNLLDSAYIVKDGDKSFPRIYGLGATLNDQTSSWNLKNTIGLSLREGFQDWAKFGLTAFVSLEKRRFKLDPRIEGLDYGEYGRGPNFSVDNVDLNNLPKEKIYDEFSTYIGAELSKRMGSILTYNARGELCLIGSDVGEFRATGDLQTRFKLFRKEATIKANAYIKNVTPAFYMRHNHSRYFWWDNDQFKKIQQIYVGGEVNLESTGTTLSAGVESIQNYIFFNKMGMPEQHGSNLQVVSARLKQDFRYRAFGWENEICWQMSGDNDVLPLPKFSAYSNMYLAAKVAKVLTVQIGANVYYNTAYYAPYYEPATQQFQVQDEVKVGNYPLINAYVNFHLKQARFFIMAYNLSSKFVEPNYFSLSHYPLNPMVLKMGIAVTFNN